MLPTPIPAPNWKPYNGPPARVKDAAGTIFYACLGSIGMDKATFYVWVWAQDKSGGVKVIEIKEPPNDQASFSIEDGRLLLTGPRDKVLVECEVPGFVAPVAPLTAAQFLGVLITQLGKDDTKVVLAVREAVGRVLVGG